MMIEDLPLEARRHEAALSQDLVLIQGYGQVTLAQAEGMYHQNRKRCLENPTGDAQAWFMYAACSEATGLPLE